MRKFENKNELENYYRGLYRRLQKVSFDLGYALTTHGSMRRDLDLVAIPWISKARGYTILYRAIFKACGAKEKDNVFPVTKIWASRSHNRVAIAIHLPFRAPDGHWAYIDLSIIKPRV